jgi:hypothetical protein
VKYVGDVSVRHGTRRLYVVGNHEGIVMEDYIEPLIPLVRIIG